MLYKHRWNKELFFRWIKQHLKGKAFRGTFFNAVKTRVYIAIITYTLVAIIKMKFGIRRSNHEVLQILSPRFSIKPGYVACFRLHAIFGLGQAG